MAVTHQEIFDTQMMARAIQLARLGRYTTMPNPSVGCVVVKDGEVVGEGWHRKAGQPHAEVLALQQADQQALGATVYVTLEPCSHHGRTPPCAAALAEAGVARLVYGMHDPNPQVAGKGVKYLQDTGVDIAGPVLEEQARRLNPGFVKRHETGLPWVTVKLAMSVDGRTAMASGESQWITGPKARSDVQRLRALSCAIATGSGTLIHDNPSLTVRADALWLADEEQVTAEEVAARQPLRVVVGSRANLPEQSQLFNGGKTLLATTDSAAVAGSELLQLPGKQGRVDLVALLAALADRDCNRVLVEAGAELSGAFMAAGLVDELIVYMAPTLLGSSARPLLALPFTEMAEQRRLKITDIRAVGDDWRISLVPDNDGMGG